MQRLTQGGVLSSRAFLIASVCESESAWAEAHSTRSSGGPAFSSPGENCRGGFRERPIYFGSGFDRISAEMGTEKEKMLAGELYDPLDPQLVHERSGAGICASSSTTPARISRRNENAFWPNSSDARPMCGFSRLSSAITARTSCWAEGVLQLQLRRARRNAGDDWR